MVGCRRLENSQANTGTEWIGLTGKWARGSVKEQSKKILRCERDGGLPKFGCLSGCLPGDG